MSCLFTHDPGMKIFHLIFGEMQRNIQSQCFVLYFFCRKHCRFTEFRKPNMIYVQADEAEYRSQLISKPSIVHVFHLAQCKFQTRIVRRCPANRTTENGNIEEKRNFE